MVPFTRHARFIISFILTKTKRKKRGSSLATIFCCKGGEDREFVQGFHSGYWSSRFVALPKERTPKLLLKLYFRLRQQMTFLQHSLHTHANRDRNSPFSLNRMLVLMDGPNIAGSCSEDMGRAIGLRTVRSFDVCVLLFIRTL